MPIIETPPALMGEAEQQLQQLYSYLYRLSENLNISLPDSNRTETIVSGETQTPKAIFESIRPLISASEDILDSYYGEIYPRLQALFVSLEDYREYTAETDASLAGTQEAVAALRESLSSVQEALAAIRDRVTATEETTASGLKWRQRTWSGGAVELWANGTMDLTAEETGIALPAAVSGAGFVSLSRGYASAVSVRDGSIFFTPSQSGSGLEISIYIHGI